MANSKAIVVQAGQTKQIPNADTLLVGVGLDQSVAGVLSLGVVNATALNIGKIGVISTVKGDFQVDGTEIIVGLSTFQGDALFDGNITIGNAATDTVTFTSRLVGDINALKETNHQITTDTATSEGAAGGDFTFAAGIGAIAQGASAGGAGGEGNFWGNNGGDGTASLAAGPGGAAVVAAGWAGADNGGGGAAGANLFLSAGVSTGTFVGGDVILDAGEGIGSGNNGTIKIGGNNPFAIEFGGSLGSTMLFKGTLQKTMQGNLDVTGGLDVSGADLTVGGANFSVDTSGNLISAGSFRLGEISDPTPVANSGFTYVKDDGGDTELFYIDDSGNVVQITQDGSVFPPDSSKQGILDGLTTAGLADGDFGYISAANVVTKTDSAAISTAKVVGANEGTVGTVTVSGPIENAKFTTAGGSPSNGASVFLADAADDTSTGAGKLTAIAPGVGVIAEVGICVDNANYAGSKTAKVLLQVKATIEN